MKTINNLFLIAFLIFAACESGDNSISDPVGPDINFLAKGGGETGYAFSNTGSVDAECLPGDEYGTYTYTLWAGKTNDAGTVTITNDDEFIYVNYNTNETADLSEVHVYVWTNPDDIPTKRPAPGHADYVVENINADEYTVVIPADLECGSVFYISTHAALTTDSPGDDDEPGDGDNSGETAYSGGNNNPGGFPNGKGAWWGYVTFIVECCEGGTSCPTLEWTLWAGQHNNAGTVTVYNDEEFIYVTYNTNESADLNELHLNILTSEPIERGSPGLYNANGYIDGDAFPADSYTIVVPLADFNLTCDDEFFIQAHAALTADDPSDDDTDEDTPISDCDGNTDNGGSNDGETAYGGLTSECSSTFDNSGETAYGGGTCVLSGPGVKGSWFCYMNYVVCCE